MTDTVTENYFRARATSFRKILIGGYNEYTEYVKGVNAYLVDGEWVRPERYDLCQHYPDFKKWVLEKMGEEGMCFHIMERFVELNASGRPYKTHMTEIKNNEILEAAVLAATEYFKDKNNDK